MTADQLFYVHRRLGNQMPCRYYLDAMCNSTASHVLLECLFIVSVEGGVQSDLRLQQDLAQYGMRPYNKHQDGGAFPDDGKDGGYFIRRYIAERTYEESEPRQL